MPADRRHVRRRCLTGGVALLASLALAVPAQAGRLIVTGHDAESHCIREEPAVQRASCAFVAASVNWVRAGAPDPSKPVLILDRGALDFQKSVDKMIAGGATVPYQVVEPRSPAFAALAISTSTYSAILIASSKNDAADPTPQDLDEVGSTPDTDAINARAADIASSSTRAAASTSCPAARPPAPTARGTTGSSRSPAPAGSCRRRRA